MSANQFSRVRAKRLATAAEWTAANTMLLPGEIGRETDTGKEKTGAGDGNGTVGTTRWNDLAYDDHGGASVSVVDDLVTNDATKALSAKQGKVLQDNKADTSSIPELAMDAIAAAIGAGTQIGISIAYNDVANSLSFTVTALGGGDVTGGSASTDGELPLYNGTSGKALKRSNSLNGIVQLTSGVVSALTQAGLRTFLNYVKADFGLGNVDNTSDANKPVCRLSNSSHSHAAL